MWPFGRKKNKVGGWLGSAGLGEWWLSTFTKQEQRDIEIAYTHFALSNGQSTESRILVQGDEKLHNKSNCWLLVQMAGSLKIPAQLSVISRLLDKAESIGSDDVLDLHFLHLSKIKTFYKARDIDPNALQIAVQACRAQIDISRAAKQGFLKEYPNSPLPSHTGYKQLSIILERQKDFAGAIELCKQAKAQGWMGDWDKRAARCQSKLDKLTPPA